VRMSDLAQCRARALAHMPKHNRNPDRPRAKRHNHTAMSPPLLPVGHAPDRTGTKRGTEEEDKHDN